MSTLTHSRPASNSADASSPARAELPSSVLDLRVISGLLRTAAELAESFLATHPLDCRCPGCRTAPHQRYTLGVLCQVADDVPGLVAALETAAPQGKFDPAEYRRWSDQAAAVAALCRASEVEYAAEQAAEPLADA